MHAIKHSDFFTGISSLYATEINRKPHTSAGDLEIDGQDISRFTICSQDVTDLDMDVNGNDLHMDVNDLDMN